LPLPDEAFPIRCGSGGWRLERAGYPAEQASVLSERRDVDLHLAVGLLRSRLSGRDRSADLAVNPSLTLGRIAGIRIGIN
jgi:hypothetical protein